MKSVLIALLSSAAVFAVLCETPALAGNGNDARFEADQAQIHPWAADQSPDWTPHDVAVGELYPKVPGAQAFYGPNGERPLGAMNAVTRSCPIVKDTTNGRETVVCGP
jgi:hypothetical protein